MPTLVEENQRLRTDLGALTDRETRLTREKRELVKRVDILGEKIAWLMAKLFGRSSEKLSAEEQEQLRLFDESEVGAQEADTDSELTVPAHIRRKAKRKPLPEALPRDEVVIDVEEEEKRCGCGADLVRIGEETSEKLDVIPPRVRVTRTIRPKYACKACEGSGDEEKPAVRIAPMPPAVIDKGIATAGLLAFIIAGKFCDHLPLYRQEKQFARIGVDLSRKTMADWMIKVAVACAPVMRAMEGRLRAGPVLQIDETTVQVLGEQGRADTSKSYMWVARGGPVDSPVIIYHYAPTRAAAMAEKILSGYSGYVQTDGYEAYDRVCLREGLVHVGCWSHTRRLFTDAKKSSKKAGSADEALAMIGKLYSAERNRGRFEDEQEFARWRRAQVEPVLEELHKWLEKKIDQVPLSAALGKAVGYALSQWPKLIRYLDHPALTPDTNAIERAIRPFVLGRKNWLFSGSPRGAASSAVLFSLIETARANGQEPYWYLRRLLEELPAARTEEDYLRLTPLPS
ncbi:MAG: IS66 family transposase [candidate division NC10 bacterium]